MTSINAGIVPCNCHYLVIFKAKLTEPDRQHTYARRADACCDGGGDGGGNTDERLLPKDLIHKGCSHKRGGCQSQLTHRQPNLHRQSTSPWFENTEEEKRWQKERDLCEHTMPISGGSWQSGPAAEQSDLTFDLLNKGTKSHSVHMVMMVFVIFDWEGQQLHL